MRKEIQNNEEDAQKASSKALDLQRSSGTSLKELEAEKENLLAELSASTEKIRALERELRVQAEFFESEESRLRREVGSTARRDLEKEHAREKSALQEKIQKLEESLQRARETADRLQRKLTVKKVSVCVGTVVDGGVNDFEPLPPSLRERIDYLLDDAKDALQILEDVRLKLKEAEKGEDDEIDDAVVGGLLSDRDIAEDRLLDALSNLCHIAQWNRRVKALVRISEALNTVSLIRLCQDAPVSIERKHLLLQKVFELLHLIVEPSQMEEFKASNGLSIIIEGLRNSDALIFTHAVGLLLTTCTDPLSMR